MGEKGGRATARQTEEPDEAEQGQLGTWGPARQGSVGAEGHQDPSPVSGLAEWPQGETALALALTPQVVCLSPRGPLFAPLLARRATRPGPRLTGSLARGRLALPAVWVPRLLHPGPLGCSVWLPWDSAPPHPHPGARLGSSSEEGGKVGVSAEEFPTRTGRM